LRQHTILGVHINVRSEVVPELQKAFSEHGCCIKTRLGLHDVSENGCSPSGLIILEMHGDQKCVKGLESKLAALPGVEVKKMEFGD